MQLTARKSLELLDIAKSHFSGTRADHIALDEAVKVLSEVLADLEKHSPVPEIAPEAKPEEQNA